MSTTLARLLRDEPIWITGTGAVSAAGPRLDDLWRSAVAGTSHAVWQDFPEGGGRYLTAPAPDPGERESTPPSVRKLDRTVRLAWAATDEAVAAAELDIDPERLGVVFATSRGPQATHMESYRLGFGRGRPSLAASGTIGSLSGALAQEFRAQGPCFTVSTACAGAAYAIIAAAESLLLGNADAVIAGGAESCLHPSVLAHLHAGGVLGSHSEDHLSCRPFDVERNGFLPGEGAGCLILESASSASKRGARPLAVLGGWASVMGFAGRAGIRADGRPVSSVIRRALEIGGLRPDDIGHVNTHGTGTIKNDHAEAKAIREIFGPLADSLPCTSTKPVTGHCLGATPALEAVLSIRSLGEGLVPATVGCDRVDPKCPIQVVCREAVPTPPGSVLSNSFGFWGYHAALVLGPC